MIWSFWRGSRLWSCTSEAAWAGYVLLMECRSLKQCHLFKIRAALMEFSEIYVQSNLWKSLGGYAMIRREKAIIIQSTWSNRKKCGISLFNLIRWLYCILALQVIHLYSNGISFRPSTDFIFLHRVNNAVLQKYIYKGNKNTFPIISIPPILMAIIFKCCF